MKPVDIVLAVFFPIIWGLGFTLAKMAFVTVEFPPILLMAFRFGVAALALVWFVKPPWGSMWRIFWIAVVGVTIQYSLVFTGLVELDASTAIIVLQLEVPFAALLAAVFFKDHMGWRRSFGMILAFIGVVLIAGQPRLQGNLVPVFLVIGGSFVWAVGQVMIKTLGGRVAGFPLIAWVAIFAAPPLFAASWLFEDGQMKAIATVGWIGWGVVFYMGLVMTALGYAIWYHLIGKYPMNKVVPYLLLVPVAAVVSSMAILGESLSLVEYAGSAIVIGGVAVIITHNPPRAANPTS
jgi:O-acetylserine/cysteine efflux transporter